MQIIIRPNSVRNKARVASSSRFSERNIVTAIIAGGFAALALVEHHGLAEARRRLMAAWEKHQAATVEGPAVIGQIGGGR